MQRMLQEEKRDKSVILIPQKKKEEIWNFTLRESVFSVGKRLIMVCVAKRGSIAIIANLQRSSYQGENALPAGFTATEGLAEIATKKIKQGEYRHLSSNREGKDEYSEGIKI